MQLAIDDFGTGYSSLAYLKRFDIDRLKVDKSFVRDMLANPADMAITRAIIALGHTLGLRIVAEGVEDLATAQVLGALDCEELQGYHFSRRCPCRSWRPGPASTSPRARRCGGCCAGLMDFYPFVSAQRQQALPAAVATPAHGHMRWPRPTGSCSRPASR